MTNLHKSYMAELGFELATLDLLSKHANDCTVEPSSFQCLSCKMIHFQERQLFVKILLRGLLEMARICSQGQQGFAF